jgi:hypothetical protein
MERSTPVTGRALATLEVVLGPVVPAMATEGLSATAAPGGTTGHPTGAPHGAVGLASVPALAEERHLSPDVAEFGAPPATEVDIDGLGQAADALAELHRQLLRLWARSVPGAGDGGSRERITDSARLVRLARLSLTATAVR